MGRKKTPTSTMNVAEKQNTDLAKRLDGLITDVNALKNYLGISAQAINQYRLGISRPSLENLCKIADYYHVTTDYLLGRTTSKSIDEDVLTTIQTVGLSDLAVYALKSDSNGKKNRDIFFIEDFLIRELYVSSWARYIRDCVRNIAQLETLRPKLGADLVEDKTEYYRWQATQRFEKSLDDAIKEFSPLYADDLKIDDISRAEQKEKDLLQKQEAAKIQTLRQYGERVFMPAKAVTISENSRSSFQGNLDRWIYPALGEMKMPDITAANISALLLDMQAQGKAHATCIKVYTVLKSLFKMAYLSDIIQKNPMDKVERPKQRKDEVRAQEPEAYTVEEVQYILSCLDREPLKWKAMIRLLVDTGIRRGECCGLQWKDIDFIL